MQETRTRMPEGKPHQEIFSAPTEKEIVEKMDSRLAELKQQGHTLTRRVPIKRLPGKYRNKPCPCGSGKKIKKCCALNVKPSIPKS